MSVRPSCAFPISFALHWNDTFFISLWMRKTKSKKRIKYKNLYIRLSNLCVFSSDGVSNFCEQRESRSFQMGIIFFCFGCFAFYVVMHRNRVTIHFHRFFLLLFCSISESVLFVWLQWSFTSSGDRRDERRARIYSFFFSSDFVILWPVSNYRNDSDNRWARFTESRGGNNFNQTKWIWMRRTTTILCFIW